MVRSNLKTPIVIAGATGCGKSAFAFYLAKKYNGEIISADSRQFYKGLSVGVASPSDFEKNLVPHHGFNSVDPKTSRMDVGIFLDFINSTVSEIQGRRKRAIIVGGTAMYLRALCFGLSDLPKKNLAIREKLENRLKVEGVKSLYEELNEIDKDCAQKISEADHFRIIRSLEIYYQSHKKPSLLRNTFNNKKPKFKAHWLYLFAKKPWLDERLLKRVRNMFENGLIEEFIMLKKHLPECSFVFDIMGYMEVKLYLTGQISKEEAIKMTHIRHRQYAKRQATWFEKEEFYLKLDASKINEYLISLEQKR